MSIQQTLTTSFKLGMVQAEQNLATNSLKIALYTALSDIGPNTTVYTTDNEVVGTGYTAGGVTVTNATPPANTNTSATAGVGYWTPSASIVYTGVTLTTAFDAMLMYNSTQSDKAVAVFTFGSQTITSGNFTLTMPSNTTSTALLRLSTT